MSDQMNAPKQKAYCHTWDQQRFFYYHQECVDNNPPDIAFEQIALDSVPEDAQCDFCYKHLHDNQQGGAR